MRCSPRWSPSLALTQFLAHGMTSPLRQMTAAARAMARGDYSIRVRATSRDEIGQLATAFNQMAADLGAADEYRRGLIANVSHELRTPITALQAVLENVVDGVAEPDAETMRMALSQTERLGELVTNLLDLSRVEGGAIPLQLSAFRVDDFLRDAVGHVALSPVGVRSRCGCRRRTLTAVADPARLRQVVVNLVDNAIRHSPAGGRVSVLASRGRAVGHCGSTSCDEGPGIPAAERERVFQRFTRGATSDGGTGLGLAIARWAVELHGGTIEVLDVRAGCRIRVTIPEPTERGAGTMTSGMTPGTRHAVDAAPAAAARPAAAAPRRARLDGVVAPGLAARPAGRGAAPAAGRRGRRRRCVGTALWRPSVLSIGYLVVGADGLRRRVRHGGARPTRAEWLGIGLTLALLAVPATARRGVAGRAVHHGGLDRRVVHAGRRTHLDCGVHRTVPAVGAAGPGARLGAARCEWLGGARRSPTSAGSPWWRR